MKKRKINLKMGRGRVGGLIIFLLFFFSGLVIANGGGAPSGLPGAPPDSVQANPEATFNSYPNLANFNSLPDPGPEDFARLPPADQAFYLGSNYRDDFAVKFYEKKGNVGVNSEVDYKYFGKKENIGKNSKADDSFFLGYGDDPTEKSRENIKALLRKEGGEAVSGYFTEKLGAPYTFTAIADDFRYDIGTEKLTNGGTTIPVESFRGKEKIRIEAVGDGINIYDKDNQAVHLEGEMEVVSVERGILERDVFSVSRGENLFSFSRTGEEEATVESLREGGFAVKGKMKGSINVPRSGEEVNRVINYESFSGELVFSSEGDVVGADKAEIDAPEVYVKGRFKSSGNDYELYAYDGKESVLAYKKVQKEGSILTVRSQGQSRERGESVKIHVDEVSPHSIYAPVQAEPAGMSVKRAREVAEAALRAPMVQGDNAEVWLSPERIYATGKVEVGYRVLAGDRPIIGVDSEGRERGVDRTQLHFTGKNERSSFDFYQEGAIDQFQTRGEVVLDYGNDFAVNIDYGQIAEEQRERMEVVVSKVPFELGTTNPFEAGKSEKLTLQCIGCPVDGEVGTVIKKMAAVREEETEFLGRKVYTTIDSNEGGLAVHLRSTAQGIVPVYDAKEAGKLASILESGKNSFLSFQKNLFLESGNEEARNHFGFSEKGIGRFTTTSAGWELERRGEAVVDFRVKQLTGGEVVVASEKEKENLGRLAQMIDGREFGQLRTLGKGDFSSEFGVRMEKEFGFNPSLLHEESYRVSVIKGLEKMGGEDSVQSWRSKVVKDLDLKEEEMDFMGRCLSQKCSQLKEGALRRGDRIAADIEVMEIRRGEAEIAFLQAGATQGEQNEEDIRKLKKGIKQIREEKIARNQRYMLTRWQKAEGGEKSEWEGRIQKEAPEVYAQMQAERGKQRAEEESRQRVEEMAGSKFSPAQLGAMELAQSTAREIERGERRIAELEGEIAALDEEFEEASPKSWYDTRHGWQGANRQKYKALKVVKRAEIERLRGEIGLEREDLEWADLSSQFEGRPDGEAIVYQHLGDRERALQLRSEAVQKLEERGEGGSADRIRAMMVSDALALGKVGTAREITSVISSPGEKKKADDYVWERTVVQPAREEFHRAQSQQMEQEDIHQLEEELSGSGAGITLDALAYLNIYNAYKGVKRAAGLEETESERRKGVISEAKARKDEWKGIVEEAYRGKSLERRAAFIEGMKSRSSQPSVQAGLTSIRAGYEERELTKEEVGKVELEEALWEARLHPDPEKHKERFKEIARNYKDTSVEFEAGVAVIQQERLEEEEATQFVMELATDAAEMAIGVGLVEAGVAGLRIGARGAAKGVGVAARKTARTGAAKLVGRTLSRAGGAVQRVGVVEKALEKGGKAYQVAKGVDIGKTAKEAVDRVKLATLKQRAVRGGLTQAEGARLARLEREIGGGVSEVAGEAAERGAKEGSMLGGSDNLVATRKIVAKETRGMAVPVLPPKGAGESLRRLRVMAQESPEAARGVDSFLKKAEVQAAFEQAGKRDELEALRREVGQQVGGRPTQVEVVSPRAGLERAGVEVDNVAGVGIPAEARLPEMREPTVPVPLREQGARLSVPRARTDKIENMVSGQRGHVALGDLHGSYDNLYDDINFDSENPLVRGKPDNLESWEWNGGDGVIVQVGDVYDRGEHAFKLRETFNRLDDESRKEGGRVVRLAGNHEMAYVQGIPVSGIDFNNYDLIRTQILEDVAEGRVVAAAAVDGQVYTHAGISLKKFPEWRGKSAQEVAEDINARFRRAMETGDFSDPIFDIGKVRGGKAEQGGIFWLDSGEIRDASDWDLGFRQYRGHEPISTEYHEGISEGAISGRKTPNVVNLDVGRTSYYGGGKGAFVRKKEGEALGEIPYSLEKINPADGDAIVKFSPAEAKQGIDDFARLQAEHGDEFSSAVTQCAMVGRAAAAPLCWESVTGVKAGRQVKVKSKGGNTYAGKFLGEDGTVIFLEDSMGKTSILKKERLELDTLSEVRAPQEVQLNSPVEVQTTAGKVQGKYMGKNEEEGFLFIEVEGEVKVFNRREADFSSLRETEALESQVAKISRNTKTGETFVSKGPKKMVLKPENMRKAGVPLVEDDSVVLMYFDSQTGEVILKEVSKGGSDLSGLPLKEGDILHAAIINKEGKIVGGGRPQIVVGGKLSDETVPQYILDKRVNSIIGEYNEQFFPKQAGRKISETPLAKVEKVEDIQIGRRGQVALGDLHGTSDNLLEDINFDPANPLVRGKPDNLESWEWNGGDGVIVQVGDVYDRGPAAFEIRKALNRLDDQARATGGRVVRLAGNHEMAYVQGIPVSGIDFNNYDLIRTQILEDVAEGRVVAAAAVDGQVYTHAGISLKKFPEWRGKSAQEVAEDINARFRRAMETGDFSDPIFDIGRKSGGQAKQGGIFWLRNDEIGDLSDLNLGYSQFRGHDPIDRKGFREGIDSLQIGTDARGSPIEVINLDVGRAGAYGGGKGKFAKSGKEKLLKEEMVSPGLTQPCVRAVGGAIGVGWAAVTEGCIPDFSGKVEVAAPSLMG